MSKSRLPIVLLLLSLVTPALAQQPPEGRPGIAVDSRGLPVIDPTKNVLDLVQALKEMLSELRSADNKYQNDMRTSEAKFTTAMREMEGRFQSSLREAAVQRQNDLAAQKQLFDLELARVLKANVDSSALLLSTQLKEVKSDLSDRTAKLEQYRYETSGRGGGIGDMIGWLAAAFMAIIALGSLFLNLRRHPIAEKV